MPKLRTNPRPRFESKVNKLMQKVPLLGKTRKKSWAEAVYIVCRRYPEIYNKYLEQLRKAAEGAE